MQRLVAIGFRWHHCPNMQFDRCGCVQYFEWVPTPPPLNSAPQVLNPQLAEPPKRKKGQCTVMHGGEEIIPLELLTKYITYARSLSVFSAA